jgi:hypothetical protein
MFDLWDERNTRQNEISPREPAEYHILGFKSHLSQQAAANLTQERFKSYESENAN